ncbi:MAG: tetratricopeptide repeat protein [Alcaligenaceae bacterium]
MKTIDSIKAAFKQGQRSEALQACVQLCAAEPANLEPKRLLALLYVVLGNFSEAKTGYHAVLALRPNDSDALFNLAVCERELHHLDAAIEIYTTYTKAHPNAVEGWVNLAECHQQLDQYQQAIVTAERAIKLTPTSFRPWLIKADALKAAGDYAAAIHQYKNALQCEPNAASYLGMGLAQQALKQVPQALESLTKALGIAQHLLPALIARAEILDAMGRSQEALVDYLAALTIKPDHEQGLKNASGLLVALNRGTEALALFNKALEVSPNLLVAKLGSAWATSKMVPLWHVPMMNESHRNDAYYEGIKTAAKAGKLVLEIGAGSGLLSMMAAKLGATQVVACEAEPLVAKTATEIVKINGYADTVTILSKISYDVEVGKDLKEKADVLIHEIFDSAIIGEHVLPAIEDAKKRLLKPDALIVPHAASIMIALMGGEAAGKYLRVEHGHGFDLSHFNSIASKKIPFYREDIALTPMSMPVDAFRFDFMNQDSYPAEEKILELTATTKGLCYGVVQWIRIELDTTTIWENPPTDIRSTTAWQRTIYRFDQPLPLTKGMVVKIAASHDRASPWFDLAK